MKKNMVTILQICEICLTKVSSSLTHNKNDNKWYFTCDTCLDDGYCVEFNRLDELDWKNHVEGKTWVDLQYFSPKFDWAKKCYESQRIQ